jgi:hypothetical protein
LGFSDFQSWRLAQPDAPQLARRLLLEAVDEAGPDVELVEGSLSDDSDEPIPSTEDEICYAIRYCSEDGLRRLLTALGVNDVLELVGTLINCDEDQRDHARAACRRNGAAEILLVREEDSWKLIAEFAEDVEPNNASWPTSVAIAQYVAAALKGIAHNE